MIYNENHLHGFYILPVFNEKTLSEDYYFNYTETPIPKCDLNKVAKQLYWNHTSAWVFSHRFAAYFYNTFSQQHLWTAASNYKNIHITTR